MTPIQEERAAQIAQKCALAGCTKEKSTRHHQLFVFERWDPHPPQEFRDFVLHRWEKEELEDKEACRNTGRSWRPTDKPNAVTLWNSDLERQTFYKSKGELL